MTGRPTKPEARSRQLNLSLTESELENIRQRAAALGMRPAHFSRALLLDSPRAQDRRDDSTDHFSRLIYGQLVRLGNNLNQMMRHLHRTGDPVPSDLAPLLNDIRNIIAQVPR